MSEWQIFLVDFEIGMIVSLFIAVFFFLLDFLDQKERNNGRN